MATVDPIAQATESGPPAIETPKSGNATSSRSSRDRPRRNHHDQRHEQHQHHRHRGDSGASRDSRFSCNICLEHVQEPVVTQCGHLYCWPCLYRWLEPGMSFEERLGLVQQSQTTTATTTPAMQYQQQHQQQQLHLTAIPMPSRRVCPVCKADCAVSTIVPIYVRNHDEQDTADENQFDDNDLNDETLVEVDNDDDDGDVKRDCETREDEAKDPTSTTGLRLRFRSRDSVIPSPESGSPERPNSQENDEDDDEEETEPPQVLPSRPTPLISSPARRNVSYHQQNSNSGRPTANAATNTTPMMGMTMTAASGPTNSLSQGLAFTLQAFLSQNLVNSNMSGSGTSSTFIPPLHRPTTRGGGGAATTSSSTTSQQVTTAVASFQGHQWGDVPSDDSATEFLSRILLLLGSFVVLCLLLC